MSLDTLKFAKSNTAFPIVPEEPSATPIDLLSHLKSDLEGDLEQAIEALLANNSRSAIRTSQGSVSTVSNFAEDDAPHAAPAIQSSGKELAGFQLPVIREEEALLESPGFAELPEPESAAILNSHEPQSYISPRFEKAPVVRAGVFATIALGGGILFFSALRFFLGTVEAPPQHRQISATAPALLPAPPPTAHLQVQEAPELPKSVQQPQQTAEPNAAHEQVTPAPAVSLPLRVIPQPLRSPQKIAPPNVVPGQAAPMKNEPPLPVPPAGPVAFPGGTDAARNVLGALTGLATPTLLPPPQERIRVGGQVAAAKLINIVEPKYPQLARQLLIHGTVQLEAVISKDGSVENVKVVTGNPLLERAAMEAVKQWRYRPTLLNGVPVEVITAVEVNFRLEQ